MLATSSDRKYLVTYCSTRQQHTQRWDHLPPASPVPCSDLFVGEIRWLCGVDIQVSVFLVRKIISVLMLKRSM